MEQIKRIRIVISQPTLGAKPSVWECSVESLLTFAVEVKKAATKCHAAREYLKGYGELHEKYLRPGEDQCRYCPAKGPNCPAHSKLVAETVLGDFALLQSEEPLPEAKFKWAPIEPNLLAAYFLKVPLIRMWCDGVEAKANAEARAGNVRPEHGIKLVAGRRGRREWKDEKLAEETLKAMRVKEDQMYTRKVISPTKAEELHKEGVIGPRQWPKVAVMIEQDEGKPTLVPVSDKRPALDIKPVADDFDPVVQEQQPQASDADLDGLL